MSLQARCHHTQSSRGSATHPKQTINSQDLARGAHRRQTSHDDTRQSESVRRPEARARCFLHHSHLSSPLQIPLSTCKCRQSICLFLASSPAPVFTLPKRGNYRALILLPVKPQRLNTAAKKTKVRGGL
ncbi:hypothetical protein J3E69DRAFT_286677 [Trichoderma sp. SZMC 28015]